MGKGRQHLKCDVASYTQQNKEGVLPKSSEEPNGCIWQAARAVNALPASWLTNQCKSLKTVGTVRKVVRARRGVHGGWAVGDVRQCPALPVCDSHGQNRIRYPAKGTCRDVVKDLQLPEVGAEPRRVLTFSWWNNPSPFYISSINAVFMVMVLLSPNVGEWWNLINMLGSFICH